MRKSLLGVFAGVILLGLLISGGGHISAEKMKEIEQAKAAEAELLMERKYAEIEPATFPQTGEVITIDDGEVPLAASIPKQGEMITIADEAVPLAAAPEGQDTEPVAVNGTELTDLGGGVLGYYDDAAAQELLSQVNLLRVDVEGVAGLSPELHAIAKERALECVADLSHNDMQTSAECVAVGQENGASVVSAWYASRTHRCYISDSAYTQAGTACIRYDEGDGQLQTIWVLVMN